MNRTFSIRRAIIQSEVNMIRLCAPRLADDTKFIPVRPVIQATVATATIAEILHAKTMCAGK